MSATMIDVSNHVLTHFPCSSVNTIQAIQAMMIQTMLDFLERYVRGHCNIWSLALLVIAMVVCGQQFNWRSGIFKLVPDKHVPGMTAGQLRDFILEPEDLDRKKRECVKPGMEKEFLCADKKLSHKQLYYVASEATTDVAFPIVYGTIVGMIFWWLFGHPGRSTLLLPMAIVIADLTENLTLIGVTIMFFLCDNVGTVPAWAVWPTTIKWSLGLLAAVVAAYGLLRKLSAR